MTIRFRFSLLIDPMTSVCAMTRSFAFLVTSLLSCIASQAQFVTYEFIDGSVVTHAITDVRSTDFEGCLLYTSPSPRD